MKKQIIISTFTNITCIIFICIIYMYKNDMNDSAIKLGLNAYVLRGYISAWFVVNIFGILASITSMITVLLINKDCDIPIIVCNAVPIAFILLNFMASISVLIGYVEYMLF